VFEVCPHCGDPGTPADLSKTATVTLTKHELRVLTFWADAYARLCGRMGLDTNHRMSLVLKTIFDRLSMQTDTPLSFMQDMADIRSSMSQKFGDGVDLIAFDGSGRCVECGESLGTLSDEDLFNHSCGGSNELPVTEEEDSPRDSS
jgi:hypothetical protein